MDNGPAREFSPPHKFEDETVYCVDCGNVFVWAKGRVCPACHAWEVAEEGGPGE